MAKVVEGFASDVSGYATGWGQSLAGAGATCEGANWKADEGCRWRMDGNRNRNGNFAFFCVVDGRRRMAMMCTDWIIFWGEGDNTVK